MSPIGRIFSVLNLILAALFLGWAANNLATSSQYKTKLEVAEAAAKAEKEDLTGQISDLRVALDTKTSEADNISNELSTANALSSRRDKDNSELKSAVDALTAASNKNASTISEFESRIGSLVSAQDQAVAAQHDAEAQRDDALATAEAATTKAADLEAQNAALGKQIADMESEIVALNGRISELSTNLATIIDVTGANVDDIMAQKLIQGSVLQVSFDVKPGLVAINVGKDSGVIRGNTFYIYDGGQYKGEVRVENVRDNMCTALILSTAKDQSITQGDRATTRL